MRAEFLEDYYMNEVSEFGFGVGCISMQWTSVPY